MKNVILECPNRKYDIVKNHPIISCIDGALCDVNCIEHDLIQWRVELQKGFKEKNFAHLSIKHIQKLEPDGTLRDIVVDVRSFFQVMKDIGLGVTNIANRIVDFGWSMSECKNFMQTIVSTNDETVKLLKVQQKNLEIQNKCLLEQNQLLQENLLAQYVTLKTLMKRIDHLSEVVTTCRKLDCHSESKENDTDKIDTTIECDKSGLNIIENGNKLKLKFDMTRKQIQDLKWKEVPIRTMTEGIHSEIPVWEYVKS